MNKHKWFALLAASIAGLLFVGGLVTEPSPPQLEASETPSPTRPLTDTGTPSAAPSPAATSDSPSTPQTGQEPSFSLNIASAGFSAPLEYISAEGGAVTPPEFDRAYIVEGFSAPLVTPDLGAIVVVFHSVRGSGTGLGNKLFNKSTGQTTLTIGDEVTLAGHTYVFKTSEPVMKDDLPTRSDIWEAGPNKLVLITCLQNQEGTPSTQNFVLTAERTQ